MKALGTVAFLGGVLAATAALANLWGASTTQVPPTDAAPRNGLVFHCSDPQLLHIRPALDRYLVSEGVDLQWVRVTLDKRSGSLVYALAEPLADAITLDLADRSALRITEELLELPTARGGKRTVITVSKKEILYALLQTGRATVFEGQACDVQALVDHVGIRQNTVAWAETLSWQWPEGGPAVWNTTYWKRGDPVKGHTLHAAVNDAFIHQEKYAIGCYTATKLVVLQGVLDYYHRVRPDPRKLALVQAQLMQDHDPLSHIEPGAMWSFESTSSEADRARPGKLLALQHGIASRNFIPGDWAYFLNTDPVTYEKTGYEGSNALYLGRGKFDDYYNDHQHAYTYKEKMHEVYQWRHKVFSRSRDVAKVHPLSAADFEQLTGTPQRGGIQMGFRAVPMLFGFQPLPSLTL